MFFSLFFFIDLLWESFSHALSLRADEGVDVKRNRTQFIFGQERYSFSGGHEL
jgi:hypothetical protein